MIYYKKNNGVFTFKDLREVLLGGRESAKKEVCMISALNPKPYP
jgi:hypothetical protein